MSSDNASAGTALPGTEPRGPVSLSVEDTVAVIRVDQPPANVLGAEVRAGLGQALGQLEGRLAASDGVRALLLECAGSTFFSGADIAEFDGPPREAEFRALFARLEALPLPVIAVMHGTALGGGLEIALACHYRIASPAARFGLPELTLGIIPGAGGTQRLPRLIGIRPTLELIFSTKPMGTQQALELGLLDEIVPGDLHAGALRFARQLLASGRGARRTAERGVEPDSGAAQVLAGFATRASREYPHRRAPGLAIEAVSAAQRLPFAEGLRLEERLVNEAKGSVECRAAVHVFFAERAARRVVDLPAETAVRPVASCGVVGAGTMGCGIAQCFANAGLPVTLLDRDDAALERGLQAIAQAYASQHARGRITAEQQQMRTSLIRGNLDEAALGSADLIVEAVYEDLALKQAVFARLDRIARPGAILATNTSTLDIEQIAGVTRRSADVIGMHFFVPAQVMPLLEVVRTPQSSAETIQTVMQLARRLRKTPVLARLCYGFIGNRMMEGYAREAERMTLEGASPREVDGALERWGMAMGILAVFDMAGIDVSVNVHRANAGRYPPDPTYYQADFALAAAGRLGRKSGRGYYRYEPGDATRHDDPDALALLRGRGAELGVQARSHSEQEIVERCVYPLINEGFRILQERVAQRASDIDVVWTAGYGFPRYRGGPMFYAETLGLPVVLAALQRHAERHGAAHWQPAPLLVELVERGCSLADWQREQMHEHA